MTPDEILVERLHEAMPNSHSFVESCRRFLEKHPMSSPAATKFTESLKNIIAMHPVVQREVQELYDRHQPNLSGGECLYAFFGHLCNLPDPIVLSKKHNPVRIHDLIATFCRLNNIPDPEPGWEKRLNPEFYREVMKMDGNCVMHHQPLSLCPECRDNHVREAGVKKEVLISQLREVVISLSVEDCACEHGSLGKEIQCLRCRALEVLEATKGG